MSEVINQETAPAAVLEHPAPYPRVTMGSVEVPELAALVEASKHLPDSDDRTIGSVEVPELEALVEASKYLPETDGVPLETAWHGFALSLLIDVLSYLWRGRNDFYVGGNIFIYYSVQHLRHADFVGPDFFYVAGVDRHRPRQYWVVWQEGGRYPDLIIELLSESTAIADRTTKKTLYEQSFHTPEYYCYDPATQRLEGWRLRCHGYEAIEPGEHGWIWSEALQLWLGNWTGEFRGCQATWLRFYDVAGRLVPTAAEAEHERAEAEHERANVEQQRAEAERQRADAAETELARLKALLAEKGITPDKPR